MVLFQGTEYLGMFLRFSGAAIMTTKLGSIHCFCFHVYDFLHPCGYLGVTTLPKAPRQVVNLSTILLSFGPICITME